MNYELFVAIVGTSGVFWAVLNASRKRPQIVLHIKGHGSSESKDSPDSHDVYFHCDIRNKSPEKNSVDKLIFTIWNQRDTEYIWEAWSVKLFKPDKKTNWVGETIDIPLVIDGKSGIECMAVLTMPNDFYFRYLADRRPRLVHNESYEKPFKYRLLLRDSNGNYYTGDLNNDKAILVDYTSLRHMSVLNTNMSNDSLYARPRLKHIFGFYLGRAYMWVRFKLRLTLYYLGIVSSL